MCLFPIFNPFSSFTILRKFIVSLKLFKGSPLPIRTILEILYPISFCIVSIWSIISPALKFLTKPSSVDAQKVHPIAQPTCVEIQAVIP